jgi:hypothetical protein
VRTPATNRVGKTSRQNCQILENLLEISRFPSPILRFPYPKIQFSSHEIQFSSSAFCLLQRLFRFLQRLSAFFDGFLIFFNGFPIFFNGFPLSDKSKKFYLRWQVYKRSLFELRISRHLLPELCNSRYNVYISPTIPPPSASKHWHLFQQPIVPIASILVADCCAFCVLSSAFLLPLDCLKKGTVVVILPCCCRPLPPLSSPSLLASIARRS